MVTDEMRRGRGWLVALTFLLASVAPGTARAADITVSAAASLTNAFQEIGREFEKANPGERVLFNFGASGQLLQQIARGAPVDAFAAADQESMDRAQQQNLIDRPSRFDFTRNRLVLAVPAGSALPVGSLQDLQRDEVQRIAIGNPESVPAGKYAKLALDKARLWEALKPKLINTQNVRQALDYVARGETDAAFVYLTDAQIMPARVRVAAPVDVPADILYPAAAVKGGGNARGGAQFVAFLKSQPARRILAKYGFLEP
jgi:molybdate transport system substrate-binding protein